MTSLFEQQREVDVPRLRKALEHVTNHPEEHDQGIWGQRTACGTSACLAGRVVLGDEGSVPLWTRMPGGSDVMYAVMVGRQMESVEERAAELLGVPHSVVASDVDGGLFAPQNTVGDLWRIASVLTGGEIVAPPGMEK